MKSLFSHFFLATAKDLWYHRAWGTWQTFGTFRSSLNELSHEVQDEDIIIDIRIELEEERDNLAK